MGSLEPSPATQAESYWDGLQKARMQVLKSFRCRECRNCFSWRAKAGDGGTVDVGFCGLHEMPLDHSDLESSQWDMCGEMLLDEMMLDD